MKTNFSLTITLIFLFVIGIKFSPSFYLTSEFWYCLGSYLIGFSIGYLEYYFNKK